MGILIIVIFQAFYIPLTVSFSIIHPVGSGMYNFDLAIDILFMFDLFLSFNTGYITHANKLILDRRLIAMNYVRGWFVVDLAASVPFDLIIQAFESSNGSSDNNTAAATSLLKSFKLPRLLRLLKLMRLMRLVKIIKINPEAVWWFQYSRHSNILRLVTLLFSIVGLVHYMTCVFYPVMEDVWFSREDCEALSLSEYDDYIDMLPSDDGGPIQSCQRNSSVTTQYVTAFYNSMLLIQGEQINPKSMSEKLYCSFLILLGSLVLAMIFGHVSLYLANFSANSTAYQRKMEYLFESMNHLMLPQNLKKRIIMYYDHIWKEYRSLDGTVHSFIPELSKQLGCEVYLYLRTNLILSVPFLRQCSPEVVQRLVTSLDTEVFLPNDYIVHKGVPGEEMYLISRGICEVTVNDFTAVGANPSTKKQKWLSRRGSLRVDVPMEHQDSSLSLNSSSTINTNGSMDVFNGRRRSSILDTMTKSVERVQGLLKGASKKDGEGSDNEKAREKEERLGIRPPSRTPSGLLMETKSYSSSGGPTPDPSEPKSYGKSTLIDAGKRLASYARSSSQRLSGRRMGSQRMSGRDIGSSQSDAPALSPRFAKRETSCEEQRKHSIDALPKRAPVRERTSLVAEGTDDITDQHKAAMAAAVAAHNGGLILGDDDDEEGNRNIHTINTSGPSRVGRVENRVAFPLQRGFSTNHVVSIFPQHDNDNGYKDENPVSPMVKLQKRLTGFAKKVIPLNPGGDEEDDERSRTEDSNAKTSSGERDNDDASSGGDGDGNGEEESEINRQSSNRFRDLIKTERVVKELLEGDYFGEIALILNTTRTCNVRAKNFVELHILNRDDFEDVVGKYAEERKLMEEIIMEKYSVQVSQLEKNKRSKQTLQEQYKLARKTSEKVDECMATVKSMKQQLDMLTEALLSTKLTEGKEKEKEKEEGQRKGGDDRQKQESVNDVIPALKPILKEATYMPQADAQARTSRGGNNAYNLSSIMMSSPPGSQRDITRNTRTLQRMSSIKETHGRIDNEESAHREEDEESEHEDEEEEEEEGKGGGEENGEGEGDINSNENNDDDNFSEKKEADRTTTCRPMDQHEPPQDEEFDALVKSLGESEP